MVLRKTIDARLPEEPFHFIFITASKCSMGQVAFKHRSQKNKSKLMFLFPPAGWQICLHTTVKEETQNVKADLKIFILFINSLISGQVKLNYLCVSKSPARPPGSPPPTRSPFALPSLATSPGALSQSRPDMSASRLESAF